MAEVNDSGADTRKPYDEFVIGQDPQSGRTRQMKTRVRIGVVAATVALGAVVFGVTTSAAAAPVVAPVQQAPAGGSGCFPWQDANTYGVKCNDRSGYNAVARCKDGSTKYGQTVVRDRWSYAYCAGHGGLKSGWVAP